MSEVRKMTAAMMEKVKCDGEQGEQMMEEEEEG